MRQGISPSTKASPSLSFVWAPAHSFFLLKKHHSAVRVPDAREAVLLLPPAKIKEPFRLFYLCCATSVGTVVGQAPQCHFVRF